MEHLPIINLVGMLVGSILPKSRPLVIAVYAEPGGDHPVRVCHAVGVDDSYDAAKELIKTFAPAVTNVWLNDNRPNWYYLQFSESHHPRELYGWALPIQAYGLWMDALADSSGLVGLSISPQQDPAPLERAAHWLGQGKADDE